MRDFEAQNLIACRCHYFPVEGIKKKKKLSQDLTFTEVANNFATIIIMIHLIKRECECPPLVAILLSQIRIQGN